MFLIRTAFWLGVILVLLPTNKDGQRLVYGTVAAAFNDMQGFCLRNPEACDHGKEAFVQLADKAVFGARMVVSMVTGGAEDIAGSKIANSWNERVADAAVDAGVAAARELAAQQVGATRSTLTAEDVKPDWRASRSSGG